MKNFSTWIFFILIIALIGGGVFVSTWEIPAPTQFIERVLPDDRFPR